MARSPASATSGHGRVAPQRRVVALRARRTKDEEHRRGRDVVAQPVLEAGDRGDVRDAARRIVSPSSARVRPIGATPWRGPPRSCRSRSAERLDRGGIVGEERDDVRAQPRLDPRARRRPRRGPRPSGGAVRVDGVADVGAVATLAPHDDVPRGVEPDEPAAASGDEPDTPLRRARRGSGPRCPGRSASGQGGTARAQAADAGGDESGRVVDVFLGERLERQHRARRWRHVRTVAAGDRRPGRDAGT